MSFDLTSSLARVTAVAAAHAESVDGGRFPKEAVDALRAEGLLGLLSATEVGGLGGTLADAFTVVHALGTVCGSSSMVACMHYCGAAVLEKTGALDVRRAVAEGRHLSTLAFSEASSRSHFWAPSSTATVEGDEVVMEARKSWITSASHATAYVWSSRPTAAEGPSTLWLVPANAPGLSVPRPYVGLGLRGNDSSPVNASGVRVPAGNRLGADGGGFDLMMGVVLPTFSVLNSAGSLGAMDRAIAGASAWCGATRHEHLGTSLADLPTIRAYIARSALRADQARTLAQDTITALATGRADAMIRVLQCKASAGEAALEVTATAMRVCGGAAYRQEVGVERAFRDAQASSVMAPTSDQLFDFLGKAACGLPLF